MGLSQSSLARVWQNEIWFQVIWLLVQGPPKQSSSFGFGESAWGWIWRPQDMTLPKPACLLPDQPFYPTLRSRGSGTEIWPTECISISACITVGFFFPSQFMLAVHSQPVPLLQEFSIKILQVKKSENTKWNSSWDMFAAITRFIVRLAQDRLAVFLRQLENNAEITVINLKGKLPGNHLETKASSIQKH